MKIALTTPPPPNLRQKNLSLGYCFHSLQFFFAANICIIVYRCATLINIEKKINGTGSCVSFHHARTEIKKKYLCETANFRNESESRTTCFKLRIGMKPRHTQPGWNKSGGRGQDAREQNPTHSRRGKRRCRKKRDFRPSSGESSGSGVHLAEGTSSSSTRTEHDILQMITDLSIHVA